MIPLTADERFHWEHGAYSYDPKTETSEQGRVRTAIRMAAAECRAREAGWTFRWEQDDITSEEHSNEQPFYPLWACLAYDADGHVVGSLGGVDFGRDVAPWGAPYRRVIEAELAYEAVPVAFLPADLNPDVP
jgi:hypothetical protein